MGFVHMFKYQFEITFYHRETRTAEPVAECVCGRAGEKGGGGGEV